MVIKRQQTRSRKGSLCIEIALIYPFFLMILFCFVFNMTVIRSEMLFKSIIIKESEKVCLLGILGEYSADVINNATNNKLETDESELIMKQSYELLLKDQIKDSYQLLCIKNKSFRSTILEHNEFLEGTLSDDNITLTSVYKIFTPFMIITRHFTIPLRLWNHGDYSGKVNQNEGRSVWLYDNFERGKILRRRFGGNLPIGYPVLSGFSCGNALIINSMDLTAPSWAYPEDVYEQMEQSVLRIAAFNGTLNPWGNNEIFISQDQIKYRYIKFIIPENSLMDKYESVFKRIIYTGYNKSVKVEIIPYQKSLPNSDKQ